MKYQLAWGYDKNTLEEDVNRLISEGYRAHGGVAINTNGSFTQRIELFQAMIKGKSTPPQ